MIRSATITCFLLALTACQKPAPQAPIKVRTPPTEVDIQQAALAAVQAAPWDADPTGWGALCSPQAPCDTVLVEPRIVSLPAQAPAFFVPDQRELVATLSPDALARDTTSGRHFRIGSYRSCNEQRETVAWKQGRVACAALGVAGLDQAWPDAMTFALLILTPAKGLSWPRVRATRPQHAWRSAVLSNAGE